MLRLHTALLMTLLLTVACGPQATTPQTPATPSATPGEPATQPSRPPGSSEETQLTAPLTGLLHLFDFKQPLEEILQGTEAQGVTRTQNRFGEPNQALAFSGQGSYLKLDIDINPSVHPNLTLALWVRHTGADNNGISQVISHDDGDFDRSIGIDHRTGTWGWSAFAGPEQQVIGGATVDGGWNFLAAVYEQASSKMTFYVNTQKLESPASHGEGHPFLYLGSNPSFLENFEGDIDDFYIYERALSEQEMQQLYLSTRP